MFSKKGNVFPNDSGYLDPQAHYRARIAEALKRDLGGTHQAVKTTMRWTGASERTAKNWIAGSHGPSGEHLIELLRHSGEVLVTVLSLAGRQEMIVATRLTSAREKLVEILRMFDDLIQGGATGEDSDTSDSSKERQTG